MPSLWIRCNIKFATSSILYFLQILMCCQLAEKPAYQKKSPGHLPGRSGVKLYFYGFGFSIASINSEWKMNLESPHLDEGCGLRKYFKISNCSQQRPGRDKAAYFSQHFSMILLSRRHSYGLKVICIVELLFRFPIPCTATRLFWQFIKAYQQQQCIFWISFVVKANI